MADTSVRGQVVTVRAVSFARGRPGPARAPARAAGRAPAPAKRPLGGLVARMLHEWWHRFAKTLGLLLRIVVPVYMLVVLLEATGWIGAVTG
ncbi:MAG: hypothetical protein GX496_12455, partial [Firmicutes bacterium]|nr:hypothetical protein [Bacillota bacterium]